MGNPQSNPPQLDENGQNWLEVVREHVEALRFGTVDITIQDGRVIQIDKTERLRFGKLIPPGSNESPKAVGQHKDRASK